MAGAPLREREATGSFVLAVLQGLLERLHREGIRYCHWKSNEHLRQALTGVTDLDMLVDRDAGLPLARILAESGFKRFAAAPSRAYPAVEDYLALDSDTGSLVHLHLHYELTLGEKHLKGYRVPWESRVLSRRKMDSEGNICIADPESELLLLLLRASLKLRLRDRIGEWTGRPILRGDLLAEYRWLHERADPREVMELARELLGSGAAEALHELLDGRIDAGGLARFRRRSRPRLSLCRTYGSLGALSRRWLRELGWLRGAVSRRYFRSIRPLQRTDPRGGRIVVFVGCDGSGKSTVAGEIATWLSRKVDVGVVYFGSGDGPGSILRWPLKLVLRLLRGAGMWRPDGSRGSRARGCEPSGRNGDWRSPRSLARAIWALVLALEKRRKLKRSWRARNRGVFVLCDRYPQSQVMGFNDGPLLSAWADHPSALLRRVARWEGIPYSGAEANPPDIVVKLNVSPPVARDRKPGMLPEEIQKRVEVVRALRYLPPAKVLDVDADRSLEAVLLDVKRAVWQEV